MITTVIFDLDDTLYDEIDYCRSGFLAAAAELSSWKKGLSKEKAFEALWQQFICGNRKQTFNAVLDEFSLPNTPQSIELLINVYRNHKPDIKLPAESKAVLDKLAAKYALALLTDGFMPAQELKVRALGIEKYFKCIVYTELLGREFWKPSPAGFEKILAKLKVTAAECVYVGDNEVKDFIAPNQLGIITIHLDKPAGIHKDPAATKEAQAQYKIKSLAELPTLLEKL